METEKKVCRDCGRELPITSFKLTRWGERVSVCTECATRKCRESRIKKLQEAELEKHRAEAQKQVRKHELEKYSPRELMEELARRGYEGKLTYTRIETIDITNF